METKQGTLPQVETKTNKVGFKIHEKALTKDKQGKRKIVDIKGKKYFEVTLFKPNFNGAVTVTGKEVGYVDSAKIIVPAYAISLDSFHPEKLYISLPESYTVNVSLDLGSTGVPLEKEPTKMQHEWDKIERLPVAALKDALNENQWISFTIAKGQLGKPYKLKNGQEHASVFIPTSDRELSEGSFVVNTNCVKKINGQDHLYSVMLSKTGLFRVIKSEQVGLDGKGEALYDNKILKEQVTGEEIASYFIRGRERELSTPRQDDIEDIVTNDKQNNDELSQNQL